MSPDRYAEPVIDAIGKALGRQVRLAEMHRGLGPGFGFGMNNFIGASPQWNTPYRDSWVDFYRDQRLAPQVRWARERGLVLNGADSLMERLGDFFSDYSPLPSVLHGDLWQSLMGSNVEFKH